VTGQKSHLGKKIGQKSDFHLGQKADGIFGPIRYYVLFLQGVFVFLDNHQKCQETHDFNVRDQDWLQSQSSQVDCPWTESYAASLEMGIVKRSTKGFDLVLNL
jgi:hypothetical protein